MASATTAAILGIPSAPRNTLERETEKPKLEKFDLYQSVKVHEKWEKFYRNLIRIHDRLVEQMSGLARESAEHLQSYSVHMADSGTDNFDRDFALSLLSSDQDALYEIKEALKRIEKGTYGVCEMTGKAIPKTRLEAIPWTRYTRDAQEQMEREGSSRQRRLGTRGTLGSVGREGAVEMMNDSGGGKNSAPPAKEQD